MKQTMRCIAAGVLAVIGIVLGERLPLQAAGTGTLQVAYSCGSGIEGAEFSAVCVARGTVQQDRMVYTLKEAYKGTGLDPQKPSFWRDKEAADRLLDWHRTRTGKASEKGTAAGIRKTTDADGNAYFTGCPAGIYLVWQSGAGGKSAAYETTGLLLVTIPANPAEERAEWSWDAAVYPKTSARPGASQPVGSSTEKTTEAAAVPEQGTAAVEPEPLQQVQVLAERGAGTGDSAAAGGLLAAAILSAAGLAEYGRVRCGRKRESFPRRP